MNVISIVLFSIICSSCASQYGPRLTHVQFYPECYQSIHDLRQAEHQIARTTLGSAAIGAGLGAVVGLVSGKDSKQRTTNALVGAAAGGVLGGMAGAMHAQKQQIKDENIRMASYLEELDGDISNLNVASAAAQYALQCYEKRYNELYFATARHRIPPYHARVRFAEIQSGRTEAVSILSHAEQNWRMKSYQYFTALQEEKKTVKSSQAKSTLVATEYKNSQFNQKIAQVSHNKQTAAVKTQADSRRVQQLLAEIDA